MRVLLLTDTHGDLEVINRLASETRATAVIHAGDFGFYDADSHLNLTDREIRLRIVHSSISDEEKRRLLEGSADQQRRHVGDHLPLSMLPEYLSRQRGFDVPVYAVWGNHEDIEVVKKFYVGDYDVPNLFVLHEMTSFHLDGLHIFGLGGNYLAGKKLFQSPIAGGGGKIWSTLGQYGKLIETAEKTTESGEYRILVSHVSSGKEPFVTLVGVHTRANLIVSGHMGAPWPLVWNEFGIRQSDESQQMLAEVADALQREHEMLDTKSYTAHAQQVQRMAAWQRENVAMGRGLKAPRWYRDMYNVNLPDVDVGHAVLTIADSAISIEARGSGLTTTLDERG